MDRGVWRASVHEVAKSRSQLSTHIQYLTMCVCHGESKPIIRYVKRGGFLPKTVYGMLILNIDLNLFCQSHPTPANLGELEEEQTGLC